MRAPLPLLVLALATGWPGAGVGERSIFGAATPGENIAGWGTRAQRFPDDPELASWLAGPRGSESGYSAVVARQEQDRDFVAPPKAPELVEVDVAAEPADVPTAAEPQPVFAGRNRFWMPSLEINRKVRPFACSRQRAPGNRLYRWGCAGSDNVYILGHAASVMRALHEAYVRGKLRVGMLAAYASSNGDVTKYRVTEWRVVDPADSSWAIADQPVPSMTLQTCVGKGGRYRLLVRLVAVD